jgi:hypothetical protein
MAVTVACVPVAVPVAVAVAMVRGVVISVGMSASRAGFGVFQRGIRVHSLSCHRVSHESGAKCTNTSRAGLRDVLESNGGANSLAGVSSMQQHKNHQYSCPTN